MWICVNLVAGYKTKNDYRIFAEESVYLVCLSDAYKSIDERLSEIENVLQPELPVLGQSVSASLFDDRLENEVVTMKYGFQKIILTDLLIEGQKKFSKISSFRLIFSDISDFTTYVDGESGLLPREILHALIRCP